MAMENKRITQLSTERLTLTSGDYVMVDNEDKGSAKYRLDRLKETDITLSVSGKAADAAATGQAISDEATARENADNALGEDIDDLKSALKGIKTDNLIDVIHESEWKQGDYNSTVAYKVTQYISVSSLVGKSIYLCGEGWDSNSQYIMTARYLNSSNTQIGIAAISLDHNVWRNNLITVPVNTDKIAIVINSNNGSIHISPTSICSQKPRLYLGLTNIKTNSDFYYQYQGSIPDPNSPTRVRIATNLFDEDSITMNKYWSGSGTGDAQGYYTADIHIKGGTRIVSSAINKDFSYYVTDGAYSTPSARQKLTTSGYASIIGSYAYADFTPTEDGYLLLTGNTGTKSDPSQVMVFEGSYVPSDYVEYGDIGAIYIGEELIYPQVADTVIVASDGSGNFEKLKDAVDYASTRQDATIYVKDGTYDLISEFGSAYFEAFDADSDEASGLQIGNGVTLIFAANTLVTANYTGNNQYVKERFSPFNLIRNSKGFTIEGLNLECANCRYGIHDEDITSPTPYKNTFKNCRIKIDNSNSSWGGKQCIGGGLGRSGIIEIENCIFESAGVADNYGVVSYHNGNGNSTKSVKNKLVIKDSYFVKGTTRVSYYGTHTQMSTALVSNNSMTSIPQCTAETASSTTVNMELTAWNNEIRAE